MPHTAVVSRQIQIARFMKALTAGDGPGLDRLLEHAALPRKQAWRLRLWRAVALDDPAQVGRVLWSWDWLSHHRMALDADSEKVLFSHVMAEAHPAILGRLLDRRVPPGAPIPGVDGTDLMPEAVRRNDIEGLRWLQSRGVDLDPQGANGLRLPTLQRVLQIKELGPTTALTIQWLLDQGVRLRQVAPPPEESHLVARPLGVLIDLAWRHNLANPVIMAQVQQLWTLMEAAGDDVQALTIAGQPTDALAHVPELQQWVAGRAQSLLRQDQAAAVSLPARRRLRS